MIDGNNMTAGNGKKMKAIVCIEPQQMALKEIDRPVLHEGEALVRIRRIGVCGTDLHAYHGRQPFFTYPRILGHELAGEIVALPKEHGSTSHGSTGHLPTESAWQIGDQVAIVPYLACGQCIACRHGKTNCCVNMQVMGVHQDGGMCEYMAVPLTHLIKTNGLSLDAIALIECFGIGAHAVRRAAMQPHETALVVGAGPIGLATMAMLKLAGVRVMAMDIQAERLAFSQSWAGVDATIMATDEQQALEQLAQLTNGDLADAVFDATGNVKAMERAFHYAAFGGRVIYVSLVQDDITFFDPDFHKKELTLLGSRNATREDLDHVVQAMESGRLDPLPMITHRAHLEAAGERFASWSQPETGVIKALVEI